MGFLVEKEGVMLWSRMRISSIVACALMVAAAALGAGCGVSKVVDPVAAAASKTEQAGGSRMAIAVTVKALGQEYTIRATGAFDHGQGEMTMDLSDVAGAAGIDPGQVTMRYLIVEGSPVMYMHAPALMKAIAGGKDWVKLDLGAAASKLGVDTSSMFGSSSQNPAEVLGMLRAAGEVHPVGTATVNGEATTEYAGTIDLEKAAKLGGSTTASLKSLESLGVPASMPFEVWIGADGLVRKLHVDESMTVSGQSMSVSIVIDLSDYGTRVDVSAPPADEVADLAALGGN